MARVLIGTSKNHLEYCASQFETVELNGVFYRTPTTASIKRWREEPSETSYSHGKRRLSENSISSLQYLLIERQLISGAKAGQVLRAGAVI